MIVARRLGRRRHLEKSGIGPCLIGRIKGGCCRILHVCYGIDAVIGVVVVVIVIAAVVVIHGTFVWTSCCCCCCCCCISHAAVALSIIGSSHCRCLRLHPGCHCQSSVACHCGCHP